MGINFTHGVFIRFLAGGALMERKCITNKNKERNCIMKMKDLGTNLKGEYDYSLLIKNLKKLRGEIILNSIFYYDYENSFGIPTTVACNFFDGFMEYICELEEEKYGEGVELSYKDLFNEFDTINNLVVWYNSIEYFGDE